MGNRMDAGSVSDPSTMPQGGTTKQHPMRAPPPSPAGQYLQVQDFTYPSINPAHYLNSLPPKHHQGIAVMGPPSVTNTPKTDPQNIPEAQPLLPQNQSEVRMMSHLWAPPNQEISVSAELYQVHEPVHTKEIQSQQRIRNKILFEEPQAWKNMIRCGLFRSTFWADLKTLRIIRESETSDMPTKEANKSYFVASVAAYRQSPGREPIQMLNLSPQGPENVIFVRCNYIYK
ncbi:hypothetical protein AVEN_157766-1 [Araneus ventricosus]|uniref:Uncharacterized protein n=1 Tax=Araneus ventricosus TaxID=182803 RepID=A0A4Y2F445_ARAVE|nr:hypothetical protein AVEN_157766-1 [Araneus ventricosus]